MKARSSTQGPGEGGDWVRPEAVAGLFYPADRGELWATLEELDERARQPEASTLPQAIIVPHAGYVYSGPIAASGYAWLRAGRGHIQTAALLGPSHRASFSGIAACSAAAFDTPLGPVALDRPLIQRLLELPFVRVLDAAHQREHALEVHLPFLMRTLDHEHHPLRIVPLLTGDVSAGSVAEVVERLWEGGVLVVVSSDLSHYYDYDTAQTLDQAASQAIERLAPQDLDARQACGSVAIKGLLVAAAKQGLKALTVDLRNSGDTAGPRDQVVGYGAYVFFRQ